MQDDRLVWGDAMWIDHDGSLLIPAQQLQRTAPYHGGISAVALPDGRVPLAAGAQADPELMPQLHLIDAFTAEPFAGNPAAVCLLDRPADAGWMRSVAAEMNLAETAFVVPAAGRFGLRWFTPTVEVDLCGHATLAAAHVLFATTAGPVHFDTRSGELTCTRRPDGWIEMDFPATPAEPAAARQGCSRPSGSDRRPCGGAGSTSCWNCRRRRPCWRSPPTSAGWRRSTPAA